MIFYELIRRYYGSIEKTSSPILLKHISNCIELQFNLETKVRYCIKLINVTLILGNYWYVILNYIGSR